MKSKCYKVLAISETKYREDQAREEQEIADYLRWNWERKGAAKGGGGLSILYKESLRAHRWIPTVSDTQKYIEKERQWLLIEGSTEKLAFLNVYIACQSNRSDAYLQWNEDLFSLLTTETQVLKAQGFSILALGDFNTRVGQIPGMEQNTPDTNNNFPMFQSFIRSTNLVILNALPITTGLFTRFQKGTKSILDYGLRDSGSVYTVSSFVIDANARFECSSDHALLEATITFGAKMSIQWHIQEALQFKFSAKSDFTKFKDYSDSECTLISSDQFSSMTTEDMLVHLTNSLKATGLKCFGIKTKQRAKGRTLPKSVINLIQTKNHLCRRLQEAYISNVSEIEQLSSTIENIKMEIKTEICKSQIARRNKLRSKLLKNDPSRKKFWTFLKNQHKTSGNITGMYIINIDTHQ